MQIQHAMRVAALTAAVAGVTVTAAASASAAPGKAPYAAWYPIELAYDNDVTEGKQDYVLFVGMPAVQWCDPSNDGPATTMTVKAKGDAADRYWLTERTSAELYEFTDGGLFEFIDWACSQPTFPEPYASGEGVVKVRGTSEYLGGFEVGPDTWYVDAFFDDYSPDDLDRAEENWFRASLVTPDGGRVHVESYAAVPTLYGPPGTVSVSVQGH